MKNACLIIGLIFVLGCQTQTLERPNVVFILVDDHALKAVSSYEGSLIETPNLERIANNGICFDAACVTNAICAPSRTVILTGTHSHINGVVDNGSRFDPSQPTFPLLMQESGYQTAMIGKWHLKSDPVGFDYWDILNGQGQYYSPVFTRSVNGSEPASRTIDGYCTDLTTDLTIDWLMKERKKNEPFLLLCHHKAPHRTWMPGPNQLELFSDTQFPEPETLFDDFSGRASAVSTQEMTISDHMYLWHDLMVPPQEGAQLEGPDKWAQGNLDRMNETQRAAWDETFDADNDSFIDSDLNGEDLTRWKYQRYMQNYLRCIKGIDDNVGRLLDYLEENDLADNTIIVYMSDQGFFLGEHGWYDKRFMYEPSLRIPLLISGPEITDKGSHSDLLVQNLDLAPTLLDLAGVEIPKRMQGQSMAPILKGDTTAWRDSIYYHYYEYPGAHSVQKHEGVRTERYKLIHYYEIDEWEMFDFKSDPNEMINLYDNPAYAGIQNELNQELRVLKVQYEVPSNQGL